MRGTKFFRVLFAAFVAAGALALASSAHADQKSLLTPDGTLYQVESGYYSSFEPNGMAADPMDYVIHWSSVDQSGLAYSGIIPGTATGEIKDQFDLAWDSVSQSLFLVWNSRYSMLNSLQFAIYQRGIWSQSQLLPSTVFTFANNPSISLTHQTVRTLDGDGNEVDYIRSVVSVVWWEDSGNPKARFAPVFIEPDGISLSDVQIYDLPAVAGISAASPGTPAASTEAAVFQNPSLQPDALSSTVLANFAEASTSTYNTVQLGFPSDLRHPSGPGALGRGHVIVILSTINRPLPIALPIAPSLFGTVIGSNFAPTLYWQDDPASVKYTTVSGTGWSDTHQINLSPALSVQSAIGLVRAMAAQN